MPRRAALACLRLTFLSALLVLCLGSTPVHADGPSEARRLLEDGQSDAALERLRAWIDSSSEVSGAPALEAARLAADLGDIEVLENLQGRLEGKPGTKEPGPMALALAATWLGLAEARMALPGGGSGAAFLFSDAEQKARDALAGPPDVAGEALRLLARARHAQGDTEGALRVLAERPDLADPHVAAAEGRLLYEHALATGVAPDGRPTPAGRDRLTRAAARLEAALAVESGLPPLEVRRTLLFRAYALHRLGDLAAARAAYLAAHAADPASDRALKGLKNLLAHDTAAYRAALHDLPGNRLVRRARVEAALAAKDAAAALAEADAFLTDEPMLPDGWLWKGHALTAAQRWDEAVRHFRRAHALEPVGRAGIVGLERAATAAMEVDVERGIAIYEEVLRLLPDDPYVRNNLGFVLREVVTPHTDIDRATALQRFRADTPHRARAWLARCVSAYADAVALIPEAKDADLDEATAWNLAGIVNDYALVLHYFVDAQDLPKAEALYLRALRMTDDSFKDTYAPNLQRLYRLLPDREWAWYRAARRCRDAVLVETGMGPDGNPVLAPDQAKRDAAAKDVEALRARLVRTLRDDARDDGVELPPAEAGGTGK